MNLEKDNRRGLGRDQNTKHESAKLLSCREPDIFYKGRWWNVDT